MKKLKCVEQIENLGIEKFINKYNLKSKDYGHKFNLKYDQLNTPKNDITNECRGIVLSKDLDVLSFPFTRFPNYDENSRKLIDWETAKIFEKTDGSLIHYYFDPVKNEWIVGTTGTAEAIDLVSCRDKINNEVNHYDFSLTTLFYDTCEKLNIELAKCEKGNTYIFELATKYNKVINRYKNDNIVLIGIRELENFKEYNQLELDNVAKKLNCDRPKEYFFDNETEMLNSLKNVKWGDTNFEGYVIVDDNFNRVKIKSNTYIIYSQFNGDIESKWRLVDVVLNNEIEEVSASFPNLKQPMIKLKNNFDIIIKPVEEKFYYLKENYNFLERKDYFIEGNKAVNFDKKLKSLLSIFSALFKNQNISFEEALDNVNKKSLYKLIK